MLEDLTKSNLVFERLPQLTVSSVATAPVLYSPTHQHSLSPTGQSYRKITPLFSTFEAKPRDSLFPLLIVKQIQRGHAPFLTCE